MILQPIIIESSLAGQLYQAVANRLEVCVSKLLAQIETVYIPCWKLFMTSADNTVVRVMHQFFIGVGVLLDDLLNMRKHPDPSFQLGKGV